MSMILVHLDNIKSIDEIRDIIANQGTSLLRAVNDAGRWAHREAERRVTKDINWPSGYINGRTLGYKAARDIKSGSVISARSRPSTMSRFAISGQSMREKHGLKFEVTKGTRKTLKKAFFFKGSNSNMLVAMRENRYRELPNINANKYVWNGLVFLYGPSVDQVFRTHRDGPQGIASEALDRLSADFDRLIGV